eukprot:TRINITY_DN52011_c0_g1_i1.p3 TRINITY_DN52011_c0_g1~~TRINITY_DN52011_c0_g1_i1.p3  ORF type:complete len:107 (+),score=18.21 TRINITY_DN52011_c0_g1_i1:89-409(+)
MVRITYVEHSGAEHAVESPVGVSIMEAAKNNMVPGIEADCGGACACATCHVFFDGEWSARVGEPNAQEADMLDVVDERQPSSRLSCQITVSETLDGVIVRLPASQR